MGMRKDKFCCCCSLKIGAIIIGLIVLINGIGLVSFCGFGLSGDENMKTAGKLSFINITDLQTWSEADIKEEDVKNDWLDSMNDLLIFDTTKDYMTAIFIISLTMGILQVAC